MMGPSCTIKLARPVRAARMAALPENACHDPSRAAASEERQQVERRLAEVEEQSRRLAQTCHVLDDLAGKLTRFYEEILTAGRQEIASLSVEIARKVLAQRVRQGDYDLEMVIQQALEIAPARQEVTVRVSPQDWEACQRLQQERPDGPWAGLKFVADPSIGPAECLVETPRGVVKSLIEEHLDKISKALEKAG